MGTFKKGKKSGKGKLNLPNGDVYEGEFLEDQITGTGSMHYADKSLTYSSIRTSIRYRQINKRTYVGEWLKGYYHGKGKLSWADGGFYEGTFVKGIREGYGILQLPNNACYKGSWKNDLQHGNGTFTDEFGKSITGEFAIGKFVRKTGQ